MADLVLNTFGWRGSILNTLLNLVNSISVLGPNSDRMDYPKGQSTSLSNKFNSCLEMFDNH